MTALAQMTPDIAADRVARYGWPELARELDGFGCAVLPGLLSADECTGIAALYDDEARFRSHMHMARQGFGCGEYKYFRYPLPDRLAALRTALNPPLAEIANRGNARLAVDVVYSCRRADFLAQCHAAGQARPTSLLLRYRPGDDNCLHQDLYGELAFPLQVAVLLSQPGADFSGGEFV